jgi:type II secretory pathway pseudopilin PulG
MRKSRAFSLIETTVAVALLGIIVVTIMSAFSAVSIAARRHQQETTLDRLTRSDAEYIKSQAYSAAAPPYLNLTAAGYSFAYQVHYYDPVTKTFTGVADSGLEELVLTVTGPNGSTETLYFLKVLP